MAVSASMRLAVAERARHRCEYCGLAQAGQENCSIGVIWINGEALTTHLLLTSQSLGQLLDGFLERRHLEAGQRFKEIVPAQTRQLGAFGLRGSGESLGLRARSGLREAVEVVTGLHAMTGAATPGKKPAPFRPCS